MNERILYVVLREYLFHYLDLLWTKQIKRVLFRQFVRLPVSSALLIMAQLSFDRRSALHATKIETNDSQNTLKFRSL